ncbi:MAG TPA: site-specific DNA-methyltransferase [Thermomicrobiales bacterium]|nr:site-specific DNA-methyltransferase [Thermomicrobiales bacterium]
MSDTPERPAHYTLAMPDLTPVSAAALPTLIGIGNLIIQGENLTILPALDPASVQLIYIDPPFNTGSTRQHAVLRTVQDEDGNRTGFGGRRYRTEQSPALTYADRFDDYIGFLAERIAFLRDLLTPSGTIYVHIDPRESHYVKVMLDEIFGRDCFVNEIIWAYDYGGRPKNRFPPKHDTILMYARTPGHHAFYPDAIDRVPYMAPGLVSPEKVARGKLPTDVWWHTIVPTNGREKTGYPTQKPLGILRRIIAASSQPGDLVLDCFAGSGTTGVAAHEAGRRYLLIDQYPAAITIMQQRLPAATTVQITT